MTIEEVYFISRKYICNNISNKLVIIDIVELSAIYIITYTRKELAKSRATLFPSLILDKKDNTFFMLPDKELKEKHIKDYYDYKNYLFDSKIEFTEKKIYDYS